MIQTNVRRQLREQDAGSQLGSASRQSYRLKFLVLCLFLQVLGAGAQTSLTAQTSAKQVASDAAANEIKLVEYGSSYLRYQVHTQDSKGNQLREVIESKDGTVARVLTRGDRPLTPQEDADEQQRLKAMLDSPEAFRKHVQKDQTGKKLAVDLMKLLPDAMLYSYTPGQPQRVDKAAQDLTELVIDFKPRSKVESAQHGLASLDRTRRPLLDRCQDAPSCPAGS